MIEQSAHFERGGAEFTLDEFCASEDHCKLWRDKGLKILEKTA